MNWEVKNLSDVVELRRGFDLPHAERRRGGVPIISAGQQVGAHDVAMVKGPGFAVGRATNLGVPTWSNGDYWPLNTTLYAADFKGNDPAFLYRLFQVIDLTGFDSGSVQPMLNRNYIAHVPVRVPCVSEQRAIAEVLGALDDKIAANERLMSAAEALMVAHVAAMSRAVCPLSNLAEHIKASVNPVTLGPSLVRHYSLPAFDANRLPAIEAADAIRSSKFVLGAPSVLISKLNPRFPRVWHVPAPMEPALASTEFVVLTPTGVSTSALWAALSQPGLGQQLVDKASGTSGSHQRVRPQEILDADVVDVRLLPVAVGELVDSLGHRVHAARIESQRLAALRDALLPELMSGRLRVKDAEKTVEEVV